MKSAGKARNNGLYRHIRTSKEIIRNLLNDYDNYFSTNGRKRNVLSPVCQKFIPVRPLAARLSEPPF